MKVALECPSRYAEGIMYSALAVLSSLDESGVLATSRTESSNRSDGVIRGINTVDYRLKFT